MNEQQPERPEGVLQPLSEFDKWREADEPSALAEDTPPYGFSHGGETAGPDAADPGAGSQAPVDAGPPSYVALPTGLPPSGAAGLVSPGRADQNSAFQQSPPVRRTLGRSAAPSDPAAGSQTRWEDQPAWDEYSATAVPFTHGAPHAKIGLWGSPASGKTTYLAALRHAVSHADGSSGKWTIFPVDEASEKLLINFSHQLVQAREFPQANELGATVPLQWLFVGDLSESRFTPRRMRRRRAPIESRFLLDLVDVSGEAFGHAPDQRQMPVPPSVVHAALDHLAQSQGLIYLFDPIAERDERFAAEYLDRTLTQLAGKVLREGRMIGRYLPHYVSVCVTKFDHPKLFQQARRAGLVNFGADGMPRVLDEHAGDFFDALCEGSFWDELDERGYASATFVRDQLRNYFHPARIRYYVTSSIGFWKPPGWDPATPGRPGFRFNPDDFANFHEANGVVKIRGPIHPINVLEPLIELQQRLTGKG